MRIAIINDFCSRNGGAAAVAIDSAIGLAKAGHEIRFVGMVGPVDHGLTAEARVRVYCANAITFLDDSRRLGAATRGLWSRGAREFVRAALSDWIDLPAIIHVHGWVKAFSPSIFSEFLERRLWQTVITIHDYFLACPNGGFVDYKKTEICHRNALSYDCLVCNCDSRSYAQKLWRFGRGLIQTYGLDIASRVDGLVGVSHFALDKLRPFLKSDVPLAVVRNPVTLERPHLLGGNPDGPLLYVGRLSPEKGLDLALTAARQLQRKLVVLGDGPLRVKLSLEYPEVEFRGWTRPLEVHAAMMSSAALVFPSRWYETNGLVVLEAMAHGLPVIVADGCAAIEFVSEGSTGRHFQIGSVESLTRVLGEVLSHQGPKLGAAAAEWYWKDPWTQTAHVVELEQFYVRL